MNNVGKYELLGLLGRGGMGEVWKARDGELGRVVALKLLSVTDRDLVERFKREARLAARLNHPGIAAVYEVGDDPPYIAMQLAEGAALDASPLPRRMKVTALRDAARAVHYAHSQGVLHRDIKPGNILVDGAGKATVLDFGLARDLASGASSLSSTGDVMGTPAYMSPEQAMGDMKAMDARTDVYGLGATLYAILAGRPPHDGKGAYEIVRKVLMDDVRPTGVDIELDVVAQKAMEKERGRRYASAEEFAEDVDRYLRGEPLAARRPTTLRRILNRVRRHPVTWALGLALAASITGGAVFGAVTFWRRKELLEAQAKELKARELVNGARAKLERVNSAMYVNGCSLTSHAALMEEARRDLASALMVLPSFAPALAGLGEAAILEGRYEEGVERFEQAVEGEGAGPEMWASLGRAILRRGMDRSSRGDLAYAEVLAEWERATRRAVECIDRAGAPGKGIEGDVVRAFRLYAVHDAEGFEALVKRMEGRKGEPGLEEIAMLRAMLKPPGEDREAMLSEAMRIRPGYVEAYLERGCSREARGDLGGAREDFDRAVEINPASPMARLNRGCFRMDRGEIEEAIRDFDAAIQSRPGMAEALCSRGAARAVQKDYDGARKDLDAAIAAAPRLTPAWVNRAKLRFDRDDFRGTVADCDEALKVDSRSVSAWHLKGDARLRLGQWSDAEGDYDRALAIDANWAPALTGRGQARIELGRPQEAEGDLTRSLAVRGRHAATYSARGRARLALLDRAGAREDFGEAITLSPEDGTPYFNRGMVELDLGEFGPAKDDLDRAIALLGEDAESVSARGVARAHLGDAVGSLKDLRRGLELAPADWPGRGRIEGWVQDVEAGKLPGP